MSASQALRAVASNGRCLHRTQSSSQELHHVNAPRDDEIAATAEANSERDAGAGTKGSSSSQEHHQASVHRDDGTAAVREAVLEGCIGAGKTGSPSPGGGQQKQPIQTAKKKIWNKRQQVSGAASGSANLVASMQVPKGVGERPAEVRNQGNRSQGIPPTLGRK